MPTEPQTPPEITEDEDLPGFIGDWSKKIEAWALSGPWWQQALKTPLTHAMVWCGAILAGTLASLVLVYGFGVYPLWSLAAPLFGFAWGQSFYWDREFGPEGDAREGGWKKQVDSYLDFWVPKLAATAAMYGIGWMHLTMAGVL